MTKASVFASLFIVLLPVLAQSQSAENPAPEQVAVQQGLKDSLQLLYNNYNKLYTDYSVLENNINALSNGIKTLQSEFSGFNGVLDENTKAVQSITKEQIFTYRTQYFNRRDKIINTTDFVETANASLNSIKLLGATADYLNAVTALNSPENKELGFSLSDEIVKILDSSIVKGKTKINGGKAGKVVDFVKDILKSPVTEVISRSVPVVGSIKSVIDLVIGTAVRGDDITVDEVAEFKNSLNAYIHHYEGLADAQSNFDNTLNTLKVRSDALSLLLRQYTIERVNTLNPGAIAKNDTSSITNIINNLYTKEKIEELIEEFEGRCNIPAVTDNSRTKENVYKIGLEDKKLMFPSYAESQARFIRDEILAVSKEYISAYSSYQAAIEKVLNETASKNIGSKQKIEDKIKALRSKLQNIALSFNDSINPELLNSKFDKIVNY